MTIPAIGGAAGYVIPDFEKGLGEFAEDVLLISPIAPALTDLLRKRFGYFMVHEAIEQAFQCGLIACDEQDGGLPAVAVNVLEPGAARHRCES
jgi:branched-chain amino acid transport system substrate-binding protein